MGMYPPARVPLIVSIVALIIVAWTIAHIGSLSEKIEELDQDREAQALEIRMLVSETETLRAASDNLRADVRRFDAEDWRDVVGDVRSAAFDVEQAIEKVRGRLANLY